MEDRFQWSEEKNRQLLEQRGVSFTDVVSSVTQRGEIDLYDHPNQGRYPGQKVFVVEIRDYLYVVPYVKQEDGSLFLKTVIPSRRAMRTYGRRRES